MSGKDLRGRFCVAWAAGWILAQGLCGLGWAERAEPGSNDDMSLVFLLPGITIALALSWWLLLEWLRRARSPSARRALGLAFLLLVLCQSILNCGGAFINLPHMFEYRSDNYPHVQEDFSVLWALLTVVMLPLATVGYFALVRTQARSPSPVSVTARDAQSTGLPEPDQPSAWDTGSRTPAGKAPRPPHVATRPPAAPMPANPTPGSPDPKSFQPPAFGTRHPKPTDPTQPQ